MYPDCLKLNRGEPGYFGQGLDGTSQFSACFRNIFSIFSFYHTWGIGDKYNSHWKQFQLNRTSTLVAIVHDGVVIWISFPFVTCLFFSILSRRKSRQSKLVLPFLTRCSRWRFARPRALLCPPTYNFWDIKNFALPFFASLATAALRVGQSNTEGERVSSDNVTTSSVRDILFLKLSQNVSNINFYFSYRRLFTTLSLLFEQKVSANLEASWLPVDPLQTRLVEEWLLHCIQVAVGLLKIAQCNVLSYHK